MLQCLTKETFGNLTVAVLRYQNIDDVPILIHRPPQIVALASDQNECFIDVPDISITIYQRVELSIYEIGHWVTTQILKKCFGALTFFNSHGLFVSGIQASLKRQI